MRQQQNTNRSVIWFLISLVWCVSPGNAAELYWSQEGGIWYHELGTRGYGTFATAFDARGVAVVDSTVYWTDVEARVPIGPTGVVRSLDTDGTNTQLLAGALFSPAGIAVDATTKTAYWTDTEQHTIMSLSLSGGREPQTIFPANPFVSHIHDLVIDPENETIYFGYINPVIDGLFPGMIGRMNLDGTGMESIVSGLSEPRGLAIDRAAQKLYWTDVLLGRSGIIRRSNFDGSDVEDIVENLRDPRGIALDTVHDQIYWADATSGKLLRTDYAGTRITDVLSGLSDPRYLAFVPGISPADLNSNGIVDLVDIDLLVDALATAKSELRFDLSGNGIVDQADIEAWLAEATLVREPRRPYERGDANLDGFVNDDDLSLLTPHLFQDVARWSAGDFSANGKIDASDFNIWNSQRSIGVASGVVPEPSFGVWTYSLAILGCCALRRVANASAHAAIA